LLELTGDLLIGGRAVPGGGGLFAAIDPSTGERLRPSFRTADADQLDEACDLAAAAFDRYRAKPLAARAEFLAAIAEAILALGDDLIDRAVVETGLPRARLEGERQRTAGQLRLFADVVREGDFLDVRIDPALPDRTPAPRPDLRLRHVPMGPVAVFGASNFPLAFSVAGGDTASALAAGCPVVVKAHPAHPGVSELVGRAVQAAIARCGMPPGVFALLHDDGTEIGGALVADPRIRAVGFTGSRRGGLALVARAQARPEPIPVYAEMSSINPVVLAPAALAARGGEIAKAFAGAVCLGAGQFCTNPGLILAIDGLAMRAFESAAAEALAGTSGATMLTGGIHQAYVDGVSGLAGHADVETLWQGAAQGRNAAAPALFATSSAAFRADPALQGEVFGPASLVVRCADADDLGRVLAALEGQLTIALHIDEADHVLARRLLPLLEGKAGRIVVNGFGTGVEVSHAMVHGGPFPATSEGRETSVGALAIRRFLRPVCYQDLPDALLAPELQAANPLGLTRRVNGRIEPG
jgi:alpha-ketoglutaric semialdehyde dehydrogenase